MKLNKIGFLLIVPCIISTTYIAAFFDTVDHEYHLGTNGIFNLNIVENGKGLYTWGKTQSQTLLPVIKAQLPVYMPKIKTMATYIHNNNELEKPNYYHLAGMICAAACKKGNRIVPTAVLGSLPAIAAITLHKGYESQISHLTSLEEQNKAETAQTEQNLLLSFNTDVYKKRLLQGATGAVALKVGVCGLNLIQRMVHNIL
jgi:hypothetical protein